jgi:hypothetical protein
LVVMVGMGILLWLRRHRGARVIAWPRKLMWLIAMCGFASADDTRVQPMWASAGIA